MPKFKWELDAAELDEAARNDEQYAPYDGPTPPTGVYGFRIKRIKTGESNAGNDRLQVTLILDPRGRKDHKKFAGFPVMDFIPVMSSTSWRVSRLLGALGVSSREFVNKTVVDEDGVVQKIGSVRIEGADILVVAQIKLDGEYMNVSRYLPKKDEEEAPDDDDDDSDADDADDDDADDDDSDDDSDDDADDDADDDSDPEPEPPKKPAKKAAAKKAEPKKAAKKTATKRSGKAPF